MERHRCQDEAANAFVLAVTLWNTNTLDPMKIYARLILGFGILTVLIMLNGVISLVKTNLVEDSFRTVIAERYPTIVAVSEVEDDLNEISASLRNALILIEPAQIRQELARSEAARNRIATAMRDVENRLKSKSGQAAFTQLASIRDRFEPLQARFAKLVGSGQTEEAAALLLGELQTLQQDYFSAIDSIINVERDLMSKSADKATDAVASVKAVTWISGCLALLVAVLVGAWIIRSISGPINQAVVVSRAVSSGDLSIHFDAAGDNETAQLLLSLKDMQNNLATVVNNVRQNSQTVAAASVQIAQGNTDLSQRTERQANSLEQTAASMKQLDTTVKENADNAKQANLLARNASTVAAKGGAVVGQVVETMRSIDASSKKVVDIITVIDEIAFQTNILALNAAVEAARAGEQGRGFAVVASEVRSLARRSAEAAKQIKDLINANVDRVSQGSALVDQAGATMSEVVGAIQRMTQLMSEISDASIEQSAGVRQIGEAIEQLDRATQENAALVQEGAAAAESLKHQAQELVQTVAIFKLARDLQHELTPRSFGTRELASEVVLAAHAA
jgi:methyl-accepting chemotaxis protein